MQEREHTFTIRDIAHKATINLGIATTQEADIKEMKADIAAIKATQSNHGELLKEIWQLLKPGEEQSHLPHHRKGGEKALEAAKICRDNLPASY